MHTHTHNHWIEATLVNGLQVYDIYKLTFESKVLAREKGEEEKEKIEKGKGRKAYRYITLTIRRREEVEEGLIRNCLCNNTRLTFTWRKRKREREREREREMFIKQQSSLTFVLLFLLDSFNSDIHSFLPINLTPVQYTCVRVCVCVSEEVEGQVQRKWLSEGESECVGEYRGSKIRGKAQRENLIEPLTLT